jgi:ubiquinone biosynthesis protein
MITDPLKAAADAWSQIPRFKEIFGIAYRYGFTDFLNLVHLHQLSEFRAKHLSEEGKIIQEKPAAERFRLALEELGPTYVKFGQILSSRRDLVNEEFYNELRKLQDHVQPFSGEEARDIVCKELGRHMEETFKSFDLKPIAAASIAQVHSAVLCDGTHAAIKIQRPNIRKKIEVDLLILKEVAKFLEKHVEQAAVLNPTGVVEDFAKTLLKELDFQNEAQNMERFAREFSDNECIRIAKVYREFTTEHVLTMDFLSGMRIDRPTELQAEGIDTKALSERVSVMIFNQVLEHGFFHGDPHPGNMAVQPDGVLVLYDYGMMGHLTPTLRDQIADLLMGLTDSDSGRIMQALIGMSDSGCVDHPQKMKADIEAFNDNYLNKPLKDINIGYVMNRLLDLLMAHKLRMKGVFYLGIKALSQIEAVGLILNPDLNFIAMGRPHAQKIFTDKLRWSNLRKTFGGLLLDVTRLVEHLPGDVREFYSRLRNGYFSIPVQHKIDPEGFEPLRKTLHQIANRLAQAILSAALLITGGLLARTEIPPVIFNLSLLAWLCMGLGLLIAARLGWKIWKDGNQG